MSFLSLFRGLEIRKEKNNIIEVSGLSFIYFYKGLARRYGSKVINNVFITMNTYSFTFHEFYLLDVVYFLEEILYNKKDRKHYQGLNVAKQVHEKLKELPLVKGFYDVREMVEYPVVDKTKLNGIFQDYMKLYDYQSKFIDACFYKVNKLGLKGYLLDAGPGLGKAQPLYSKIKVPGGWTTMGEIQVGDIVETPDGLPARVISTTEQGKRPVYEITFSDGRKVRCDIGHLWNIHWYRWKNKNDPMDDGYRTITMEELIRKHEIVRRKGKYLKVPLVTRPLSAYQEHIELPLDPWLLGVLIGDGCLGEYRANGNNKTGHLNLTNPEYFIIDKVSDIVSRYGCKLSRYNVKKSCPTFGISKKEGQDVNSIRKIIKEIGLSGLRSWEKHIPEIYFKASYDQRLQLIRGLMDTDGHVTENGSLEFCTTSEKLAHQFRELVFSIGGICRIRRKETHYLKDGIRHKCKDAWVLNIRHQTPSIFFNLPRKKMRTKDDGQYSIHGVKLNILDIKYIGEEETKCIRIDSPEMLYVTDGYVVTHNSYTSLAIAELLDVERIIVVCPKKAVLDVWETYIDQYYQKEQNYCLSLNKVKNTSKSNSFDIDKRFYVVHYEAMEMVIEYLNRNPDDNRKTMIILDESHNFNTHDSSRSILFRELCRKANSSFTLWVSGTPFKAMGKEIFSLAYTVDPLFDSSVEKSFFDIYGKNSKMSLEILSNRIQMMRTPIPAKQMTTKLSVHSVKVKVPNGERFTLRAVSNDMKKYIEERFRFYQKNMKDYVNDYFNAIEEFKRSSNYKSNKDELSEYLTITSKFHKHGFNSYDKKDIEDSKKAKAFEEKIIIPSLSSETKKTFRKAKSIYKYVDLAIVGEALGNVLGKARIECNREIIKALGEKRNVIVEWEDGERTQSTIDELIANSVGKTICFTDYIEVVKQLENDLIERNHKPITVFGENTNELNKRVGIFMNDKVTNPLVTTYKSLGEAVPLTVATSVFFLNMPFRSGIEDQAVKRAWRIGNKHDVDLFKVTLDTGTAKNVSTRSEDIAAWSRDMVAVLLKEKSADDVFITKFIEESVINGEEDNSFPTKIKTLIRKAFG